MQYPLKNWRRLKRGYGFGEKTFYSPFHLGADYIVPKGTPVFAPAGCEVFIVGDFPEGGNTIHIRLKNRKYGPLVMRFMHLSKMSPLGKYKAGDILSLTGNTGKLTTAPHLHIDISSDSVKIGNFKNFLDPDKFFSKNIKNVYYLYILECADKTLYTGITTDLKRRVVEHNGAKLSSKYTSARRPVNLVYSQKFKNRSAASKEEARIKKMKKSDKLALIQKSKKI
jgi:putative endonuclease